jgi:hypothetical protein
MENQLCKAPDCNGLIECARIKYPREFDGYLSGGKSEFNFIRKEIIISGNGNLNIDVLDDHLNKFLDSKS